MICGHGSRHKDTSTEFQNFIKKIKKRFPKNPLSYGFLEISSPNVKLELTKLIRAKTSRILTVPVMLFAAGHIKKDIPDLINLELSPSISSCSAGTPSLDNLGRYRSLLDNSRNSDETEKIILKKFNEVFHQ